MVFYYFKYSYFCEILTSSIASALAHWMFFLVKFQKSVTYIYTSIEDGSEKFKKYALRKKMNIFHYMNNTYFNWVSQSFSSNMGNAMKIGKNV